MKIYALTTEGVKNASVEFDVETTSPTYKLLIGVPGKSNAFEISRRLGLSENIIDYARTLISKENIEFEDVLQAIERDRLAIEENRAVAEKYRLEVERLKEDLAKEKDKTKEMRDKIIQKAKEEARSILKQAKEEADGIVKELRSISAEIEKDRSRRIQEAQEKLKEKLNKIEAEVSDNIFNVKSNKPPKDLKVGETVEVLTFNQMGTVLEEPDENGNVKVQVGIMKINAHISTLRRGEKEEEAQIRGSIKSIMGSKAKDVKPEIDLRGKLR